MLFLMGGHVRAPLGKGPPGGGANKGGAFPPNFMKNLLGFFMQPGAIAHPLVLWRVPPRNQSFVGLKFWGRPRTREAWAPVHQNKNFLGLFLQ